MSGHMRGPGRGVPIGRAKMDKVTMNRLLSYLKEYKLRFTVVLFCILVSAVAGVAGSLFLQVVIDDYITPLLKTASPDFAGLFQAVLTMAAIYLIGILATLFYNRTMVSISQGILKKIRDQMFSHMQRLPIRYFDTHTHGDIMSRYTNDTDTLRQMLSMSVPQMFSSIVTIVAVICAMLYTSVYLTILVAVVVFFIMKVFKFIASHSGKYFIKQQETLGDVNGYIEEMINGQKVVKVFCHEEKAKEVFREKNAALCENATKANQYANILMPIMMNLGNLQYILIAIVGGALAVNGIGGLTLGAIASFLQLSKSFSTPISQVSQQINSVVMALAGAKRIFELLDEEEEADDGYVTLVNAKYDDNGELVECPEHTGLWAWKHPHSADGSVSYTELTGDVVFENVTFGYNEDKVILKNISLYAKPGQKLAFVGSTGAGKTTITNLINRFYDIQEGKIRYDGINITKIKKDDLRRSLGIVLQDTHLFTGTIMDNIRYGKLDATDEEVYQAARLAHADQFIQMLPNGYQTMLSGDGEELSQGQRQLLSIARAAVADPPVLILDEATSSIDTRTESIVQKGMDNLMKGRTVFVIAHRLSTIRNSNAIIVLDHGNIIERGDHEDLIKMKGTYYQLYTGKLELS